ncbi:MAG: hypothetical protein K2O91_02900 [Lachnospiraceae bacterium]|nr:hypothetical protein [Lachnospiraceae bacterium]
MTYDKGQLSDVPDTSQNVLVIASEKELMNFLMDILEIGNGIESEETLQKIKSYRILFSFLSRISVLTIVIEDKYVDRIYRDSFYMHFSCKHGDYSRFCKRLFLFWGDVFEDTEKQMFSELDANDLQKRFIGTVVIRPLIEGKVGRSLINPYFILGKADTYLRYAKYSATIYGIRLRISAFPFSMQDGETTTCAEITILNLIDYFSRKYSEYKNILPSQIAEIVRENDFERTLPSRGLKYSLITKVFSEAGFYPRLYGKNAFSDMSQFKRVMHYYIESGIPVAVGAKVDEKTKHSIICIGHGRLRHEDIGRKIYAVFDTAAGSHIWLVDSSDLCSDYIVMDDGSAPYGECEWKVKEPHDIKKPNKCMMGSYEPEMLMVPLSKRMFLEAQDAYDICTSALASKKVGIRRFYPKVGTREDPVIIRIFMCSSRNYKQRRITNFSNRNKEVCIRYQKLRLPKFIWVCEIYDKEGYINGRAKGELVIDATASPDYGEKSILLVHYPYHIMVCRKNVENVDKIFDEDETFDKVHDWEQFNGYDHNLFQTEKLK